MQVAGFVWVIMDTSATLSQEHDRPGIVRRAWRWLVYWLSPPGDTYHDVMSGQVHFGGSLRVQVTASSEETDLDRLQREVHELREAFQQHQNDVGQRFVAAETRVSELRADTDARITELGKSQTERDRVGLLRDLRGAYLFMLGAIVTTIAAVLGVTNPPSGSAISPTGQQSARSATIVHASGRTTR
jgi:hypothetical protein